DYRSRVLHAAVCHQAFLEAEPGAPSVRIRLHGESQAGGLRERVLHARALSPNLLPRGRRRAGAVENGVPAPGIGQLRGSLLEALRLHVPVRILTEPAVLTGEHRARLLVALQLPRRPA